ncbi:MAG: VWA domain-containing protein [Acidobacteriota bacterium]|nr:VWA domain-containing protein [Acidobacteriota bacterium]MDH3528111.1 VWA domain-containing protein [Acidobacteriota bacterium]
MKSLSKIIFAFFAFSIGAASVLAQDPTPTPPDDDEPVSVFEVRLPVTVTEKKKKKELVTGLNQNDFIIYEDGVPQETTFFTNELNNPPVFVGVLMDTSPSTSGKLTFSKRAAKDFLYTVLQLRKDKGAFMTFDHRVELHQDFTDKTDLLDRAVERIKDVGSQTALYDAIWQFADQKLRNAPGRRVIVVITDGDDTFSKAELEDAIDIAQRTETTIFGISTKEGFLGSVPGVEVGTIKDKGDKLLEKLCEETGGRAFFTGDMLALERSFAKISKELKGQYIVTYKPENQEFDGKTRKIEVRFRDKKLEKKYRIRTKTEYRAIRDTLK